MTDLSIIIVTFNRAEILKIALESLQEILSKLECDFEIIVADDCSDELNKALLGQMASIKIVRTKINSGLGANVNNGISATNGRLVLQMQDDWKYISNPETIINAINFLRNNVDIGIVQLTPVGSDLPICKRLNGDTSYSVFRNDRLPWFRNCGIRPYSDQPHIKKRDFIDDIGPYLEGVPMTLCENEYKKRVANQMRWKVAMIDGSSKFIHLGAESSHNPGGRRHPVVKILHRSKIGKYILEPLLRRIVHFFDHLAAEIASSKK